MFRPETRRKCGNKRCIIETDSKLKVQMDLKMIHPLCRSGLAARLALFIFLALIGGAGRAAAQSVPAPASTAAAKATNAVPGYEVQGYVIEGRTVPPTNVLVALFSKYSGTNVSLDEIISAASDLESEYVREGNLTMNIVIAPKRIKDGIVTMDVFPGAMAQIVVAGNRYMYTTNGVAVAMNPPASTTTPPAETNAPPANTATNAGPRFTVEDRKSVV